MGHLYHGYVSHNQRILSQGHPLLTMGPGHFVVIFYIPLHGDELASELKITPNGGDGLWQEIYIQNATHMWIDMLRLLAIYHSIPILIIPKWSLLSLFMAFSLHE